MTTKRDPRPQRPGSKFGETFDQVFKDEVECVGHRWQSVYGDERKPDEPQTVRKLAGPTPSTENNLVGLAFSGGGIRSATINMGITQALHRRGVFDHVDYLSTVSGGGYLGSSISTAMRELPEDGEHAPEQKGKFPYAYEEPATCNDEAPTDAPGDVESKFLTWVRNNSNYMATGDFLDWPRIFGVLLRGMLANFLVLLPILLALAVVLVWFHGGMLARWNVDDLALVDLRKEAATAAEEADRLQDLNAGGDADARREATAAKMNAERLAQDIKIKAAAAPKLSGFFRVALSIAGGFLLLVLIFPVMIRVYKVYQEGVVEESSVESRGGVEKAFGLLLVLAVVAAAAEALPLLIRWFHQMEATGVRGLYAGASSGAALVIFTAAGRMLSALGGLRQKIILMLVGLLGLVIPLVVALYVADDLIYFHAEPGPGAEAEVRALVAAADGRPAYLVKSYEPMELTKPFGETGFVRLLPGLLLIIMGGGAGAAAVGKLFDKGKTRAVFTVVGIAIGACLGYLLLVGSSNLLAILGDLVDSDGIRPDFLVLTMAVVVLFFCWVAVDVNLTAVLGLYRDRLATAYLIGVRWKKDDKGNDTAEEEIFVEPDLNLEDLCGGTPKSLKERNKKPPGEGSGDAGEACCRRSWAPYHLVNTTLNLQGSKDPMLRDRGSDFFMFSKLYYGGHRTGYCETWRLEKVYPQMDLPTAMAISAAAASPNSGRVTNKPLVALMTLLNVRLGYWVPHPGRLYDWLEENERDTSDLSQRWKWRVRPWALLLEMGSKVSEKGKWVNLSDGGHLENLALYELLRRRCKYIICGDGEADPTLTFGGLATLMRSARIDMGIEIEILLDDLRLGDDRKSHQHAALGKILYPSQHRQVRRKEEGTCPVCGGELEDFQDAAINELDASEVEADERYRCPRGELEVGHLLYIKSSFTGNEDETMQEYRSKSPDFPHESTADQFFDEGQFEAYRALGFHMADGLFPPVKPGESPGTCLEWKGFTGWFDRLRIQLAPRLSAKHEALKDQLRRISKLLQRDEFHGYFYELHPSLKEFRKDLRAEAGSKQPPEAEKPLAAKAGIQQITYLVGLQLDLMENAFLNLNLDQPVNWNHPGNQGWRTLFEGWAQSEDFKIAYALLSHLYSGRFQIFCRERLDLVSGEVFEVAVAEARLEASAEERPPG